MKLDNHPVYPFVSFPGSHSVGRKARPASRDFHAVEAVAHSEEAYQIAKESPCAFEDMGDDRNHHAYRGVQDHRQLCCDQDYPDDCDGEESCHTANVNVDDLIWTAGSHHPLDPDDASAHDVGDHPPDRNIDAVSLLLPSSRVCDPIKEYGNGVSQDPNSRPTLSQFENRSHLFLPALFFLALLFCTLLLLLDRLDLLLQCGIVHHCLIGKLFLTLDRK